LILVVEDEPIIAPRYQRNRLGTCSGTC